MGSQWICATTTSKSSSTNSDARSSRSAMKMDLKKLLSMHRSWAHQSTALAVSAARWPATLRFNLLAHRRAPPPTPSWCVATSRSSSS